MGVYFMLNVHKRYTKLWDEGLSHEVTLSVTPTMDGSWESPLLP